MGKRDVNPYLGAGVESNGNMKGNKGGKKCKMRNTNKSRDPLETELGMEVISTPWSLDPQPI